MINIRVQNSISEVQSLEIPEGINLNLMETLKAFEYNFCELPAVALHCVPTAIARC